MVYLLINYILEQKSDIVAVSIINIYMYIYLIILDSIIIVSKMVNFLSTVNMGKLKNTKHRLRMSLSLCKTINYFLFIYLSFLVPPSPVT